MTLLENAGGSVRIGCRPLAVLFYVMSPSLSPSLAQSGARRRRGHAPGPSAARYRPALMASRPTHEYADLGVAQRACDSKIHGKSTQARRRQHRSHKILPRRRFPPKLKLRADVCGSEERPAGGVQGVIRRSRTARADRVFRLDMSIFDIRNVTGRVN